MSFQSKRELLIQVRPRYREAGKKEKSRILNEFIAATGYKRKYAIKLLNMTGMLPVKQIQRKRSAYYGPEVVDALCVAWAAANYIGSKRLAPFLEELVPKLEQFDYLDLTPEVRNQLLKISPATIDRLLKPHRSNANLRGFSTTKPGAILKKQIKIRTFADWDEKGPGFFEGDLVAHCGGSMEGSFLYTLVLTDIQTGWVECLPLLHRSQNAVIQALDYARQLLPFKMLGLDTDNGSEFINYELLAYCEREKITFTRGRSHKKNDQCYVEQKNGAIVRQIVGYDRFDGERAYRQLSELYRAVRLYVNFFQPSMKLKNKKRDGNKVRRSYETAQTPFQRLLSSEILNKNKYDRLGEIYKLLNPVKILEQINFLQDALWQHAILPIKDDINEPSDVSVKFDVKECGLSGEQPSENLENSLKRKYRRTEKPKKDRDWRTRKDPFEEAWPEIQIWLEANPERTAKSLLLELQRRYPDKYTINQLRTLQRRVKDWRANAIITFNDEWMKEEILNDGSSFEIMAETN